MSAAWLVFRTQARRRWRGWLALALLIGVSGGVITAIAAGARRTDTAYPRLLSWSDPPDAIFFSSPTVSPAFADIPARSVTRLPQVAETGFIAGYTAVNPAGLDVVAPTGRRIPTVFWHRKLLAGRLPDPRRPAEADISFTVAAHLHLAAGDTLRIGLLAADHRVVQVRLRIVGIDAAPAEFPPQTNAGLDAVWVTPAFYQRHARQGLATATTLALRLRHGAADWPALQRAITRLAHGRITEAFPLATQAVNTEHAIHVQAVALWLLAGLLAVIGVAVLSQLLARLSFLESADNADLGALGMTRGQLLAAALIRAALIGACGGAVAAVIVVALSPSFPLGLARIAEPAPGFDVDPAALAAGFAGSLAATIGCAAWPSWRAAAGRPETAAAAAAGSPPALAKLAAALQPVTGTVGVRLALHRGAGRSALPIRSTIASAAVGVTALTGALVFSGSLSHLLATPALYGVTWDATVGDIGSAQGILPAVPVIARDPDVAAWQTGYVAAPLKIGGIAADAIAMNPGHGGAMLPVPVHGRLPEQANEIAVGARTLAATGSHIGATVKVALDGTHPAPMRIVGVAVFPAFSDTLDLGKGSAVTMQGLLRLLPPGMSPPALDHVMVRFRPGAAGAAARLTAALQRRGPFSADGPAAPADLVNFGRVQNTPLLFGGSLGALALLNIVHLLVTSIRRRRRDLAVLRMLGFTRGQVRAAVAWQSATLAAAALAIGVPFGLVSGRLSWQLFSGQLGIVPVPRVPLLALAVLVAAAFGLAAAAAVVPGESAARVSPATVLRSE